MATTQTALVLMGLASVFLSIFIWQGKNWAYKSVLGILAIGLLCLVTLSIIDFAESTHSLVGAVGNISFYISLLMVPLFFIYVLIRDDVKSEFEN